LRGADIGQADTALLLKLAPVALLTTIDPGLVGIVAGRVKLIGYDF
jgi:hypothetical protein